MSRNKMLHISVPFALKNCNFNRSEQHENEVKKITNKINYRIISGNAKFESKCM